MSNPGPCQVTELPAPYRERFTSGTIQELEGRFFPGQIPNNAITATVVFGLMYFLPAVFLIVSGLSAWYQRAPWISRVADSVSGSWVMLLVFLAIATVIIWSLGWMLRTCWLAWLRLRSWQTIKAQMAGTKAHHGLLLDEHNLVFCHGEHFDEYTCGWLPKSAIQSCEATAIRQWFPKHSYYIKVVRIQYTDPKDETQELILKERFGMGTEEMSSVITEWAGSGNGLLRSG